MGEVPVTVNRVTIDSSSSLQLPDHLLPVFEESKANLQPDEQIKVAHLLNKYQHVFSKTKSDLGKTGLVKHKINTGLAPPIKQHPRRLPQVVQEEVNKEVDRLLEAKIIEKSNGPWASPIVPVKKPDGSLRLAIDYRKLNAVTLKDSYPLPRIQDCLDCLSGAKFYSSLDCSSGFHQVEMDPDDMDKTSFVCQKGQYRFKVLSFGLTNAVATYQRLMEFIMAGLQYETVLIYVDDILVFTRDFDLHILQLEEVLKRLETANLKVMPKKCHLFQTRLHFLGHVVDENGITANDEKVKVIKEWPTPRTAKQLSSFLGLVSYYRRQIKGFADIASPLHRLTHKDAKYIWTNECDLAFCKLKQALIEAPVLGYPNSTDPYILDTDCSSYCLGAVLQQKQDGIVRVIAYYSRTLNRPERQYCVTRRELLAIVEAVQHFHNYLYGVHFLIRTDHSALSWALKFRTPMGQLSRWMNTLSLYDFNVEHRPGSKHTNADSLSRRPCGNCTYCEKREQEDQEPTDDRCVPSCRVMTRKQTRVTRPETVKEKEVIDVTDLAKETANDGVLNGQDLINPSHCDLERQKLDPKTSNSVDPLRNSCCTDDWNSVEFLDWQLYQTEDVNLRVLQRYLSQNVRPKWEDISHLGSEFKHYWSIWPSLVLKFGVICKLHQNKFDETIYQILVPFKCRKQVMHYVHDHMSSGHLGEDKTYQRLKQYFYWVNAQQDVSLYCRKCVVCQAQKMPRKTPKAPLQSTVVGVPFEKCGMDILGPIPLSDRGNKYILSVTDYFTKWVELYPMPDMKVETIVVILVSEFISRYGLMKQLLTDQGRQFESLLFQQLCTSLGIEKLRCSAFHPATNGLTERFNKTIEEMLSKYVSHHQRDWDQWLPILLLAYRSSVHASTKHTPYQLMFGHDPTLPLDLIHGQSLNKPDLLSPDDYMIKLKQRLQFCHENARSQMLLAAKRQKHSYDQRLNTIPYAPGDNVWVKVMARVKGRSPKLSQRWEGPYKVVKCISNLVVRVKNAKRTRNVHHNLLKPYD
jgi:hypothetical protein